MAGGSGDSKSIYNWTCSPTYSWENFKKPVTGIVGRGIRPVINNQVGFRKLTKSTCPRGAGRCTEGSCRFWMTMEYLGVSTAVRSVFCSQGAAVRA